MTRILAALAVTVVLGILSRSRPIGWYPYDKSLGDLLYAVAAYLVLALLLRRSPGFIAALALGLCLAVESFKLTGIPEQLNHWGIVRWLLGTTFSWHNLACYALGIIGIWGLDRSLLRPRTLLPE
jgi:hypothetical protein